ncbi:MAG: DUF1761 family protein [Methyloceanibacter sp.]
MTVSGVNSFAVIIAALAGFGFGAIWYMVLGGVWLRAIGKTEGDFKQNSGLAKAMPFVIAIVALLVMATMLAGIMAHLGSYTVRGGVIAGALIWLGFEGLAGFVPAGLDRLGLDGDLHAANTDAYGFMRNIDAEAPQWNEGLGAVMVLGAGGAARAVLFGLIEAGVPRILLANRTRPRADALAKVFGPSIEVIDWEKRSEALGACGALINTTSLGMTGQAPLDIDLAALPADAVVTDIVYNPLETKLLSEARARGLTAVDGLGMLLHQAVPGFERWFGVRPEVTPELKAHVVATL